jgi:hypothetical protein
MCHQDRLARFVDAVRGCRLSWAASRRDQGIGVPAQPGRGHRGIEGVTESLNTSNWGSSPRQSRSKVFVPSGLGIELRIRPVHGTINARPHFIRQGMYYAQQIKQTTKTSHVWHHYRTGTDVWDVSSDVF